ncbi:MAG: glycoside hydrolase family 18 protein [Clostridiales bacterium]|nr:glycoside hydrolase family 18 protein [Clostridiales bacterium]
MKKAKKIIALFSLLAVITSALSGCSSKKNIIKLEDTASLKQNLLVNSTAHDMNGQECDLSLSGKNDEITFIEITLAEKSKINTLILTENAENVTAFNIYLDDEKVYSGSSIGEYRACAFETKEAEKIKLEVTKSKSRFTISNISAYLSEKDEAVEKQVSAFISAENASNLSKLDAKVNEFIIYGCVSFNENGELVFSNKNDENSDAKTLLANAVNNLKTYTAQSGTKLSLMISAPEIEKEKSDKFISLKNNGDKVISAYNSGNLIVNILNILDEYGFDGVTLKWDYPATEKQWKALSDIITSLKTADMSKCVSLSISDYACRLSKQSYQYIDKIILEAYDVFNNGQHSAYSDCLRLVSKLNSNGCELSKIQLAIPMYARTSDKADIIFPYKTEAYKLDQNKESVEGEITGNFGQEDTTITSTRYYNSYQTVFDKTAYAVSLGLYGVAVFDYCYDLPYYDELSLIKAVDKAYESRTVNNSNENNEETTVDN